LNISQKDVLSPDVLSLRMFAPHGCFVCRTYRPAGGFVPPDFLSRVPPDVLSHGRYVSGCYVTGRFVSGRFVWAPFISSNIFDSVGMRKRRRYSRACVLVPQTGSHQSYKLECSRRSKPNWGGGRGLNEFHLQGEAWEIFL
jgi:hypothetical protein